MTDVSSTADRTAHQPQHAPYIPARFVKQAAADHDVLPFHVATAIDIDLHPDSHTRDLLGEFDDDEIRYRDPDAGYVVVGLVHGEYGWLHSELLEEYGDAPAIDATLRLTDLTEDTLSDDAPDVYWSDVITAMRDVYRRMDKTTNNDPHIDSYPASYPQVVPTDE